MIRRFLVTLSLCAFSILLTDCGPQSSDNLSDFDVDSDLRYVAPTHDIHTSRDREIGSLGCCLSELDCMNGLDDDLDGLSDCSDADCSSSAPCLDQDYDFYTPAQGDCDDFDALINPSAEEICFNTVDDNCDTFTDENCSFENDCNNNTDDDNDGMIDCSDSDCEGSTFCIDSDGDEYSLGEGDCDDDNYLVNPGVSEICYNYIDDNCDSGIDEFCYYETDCTNSVDDDLDGLIDCEDQDCADHILCIYGYDDPTSQWRHHTIRL